MNILAIDDSKLIRSMLNNVLTGAGHTVTMACDGIEGAELAAQTKYDLIITDINMPEMNGFELVTHLRGISEYKSVPCIFLSSDPEEEYKEKGAESTVCAWITKPFSPINLLEVVSAVTRRMNVLAVDDSKLTRNMLYNVLTGAGHNVTMACEGREAAELAAQSRFDLIITDVMMPEMDGFDLAKHLRSTSEYKTVPIVFLTTETREESIVKGREAGATAWVTKPFSPISLLAVVDKI